MKVVGPSRMENHTIKFMLISVVLVASFFILIYTITQYGDRVRIKQAITTSEQQDINAGVTVIGSAGESNINNSDSNATSGDSYVSTKSSVSIPNTGPESMFIKMISIGLLSSALVGYVLSRRRLMNDL
ncbi:MAG: hypothetical protein PWQ10_77 [Patescibacteria group bacterium]|nr:hypothetical protein [Patescibacteria group bacterium]